MYGSMTIVIVLQGQLDYCSRAKDKMHGVFCLRHYPKEHWRLQVLSWSFKLSCAVESGSGSMICDLQWWSKSFLITGQEVYRLFQSMPLTCCVLSCFNRDRLSKTPRTVACQAPLSMGFSRQESWSGLPHPPLVDLYDLGVESASLLSPDLAGGFFITNATWEVLKTVQFNSVPQLCLTLCDPMNCSMPGLPVHHQLLEFTQTQVHWVGDAVQPSHPLLSPSPPALNLSQHQGLFIWVSLHQVAKVLEFQLQHQSFQWILRTDFL